MQWEPHPLAALCPADAPRVALMENACEGWLSAGWMKDVQTTDKSRLKRLR